MTVVAAAESVVRRRIRVTGVVQGVGFRPFVHRLANELGLAGQVGNDVDGVFAEVEGRGADVEAFVERVTTDAPPLARVHRVTSTVVVARGERGFRIVDSRARGPGRTFVSPDVAVCADCLAELFDPNDRRYRYPFVNCTNCGPRFTITVRLPYDRPNTTMAGFDLCPDCRRDYDDPADRRFHAQPVACAACGPRLWFDGPQGSVDGTDPALAAAQSALAGGGIVAVKGLGGYHLACDATDDAAVDRLRRRKQRPHKAFAVMVRDVAVGRRLARIDATEAAVLAGRAAPIVLVDRLAGSGLAASELAPSVAPGNPRLGVFLPYTPLHHLLFRPVPGIDAPAPEALVMTSGNLSDEPICTDAADARRRLGRIADGWLDHDRPIHLPCDDSVVEVATGEERPVRRSRGYAPLPVELPFDVPPLLATGGELKNTFCLAAGRDAWMSHHVGDMGSVETLAAFERSTRQFIRIYDVVPRRTVTDAHPGYQVRRWADERAGRPVDVVQHHHAHVASLMVEHHVGAGERVIGIAFDGTGYGPDGAIWGGEILVAGYRRFERAGHLRYVRLPGGDAAVRRPYRMALAHLRAAGIEWSPDLPPVRVASAPERATIGRQLDQESGGVPTSSVGRLFDAVSSLLDVCHVVSYEAQAAIELEALAAPCLDQAAGYRIAVVGGELDPTPLLWSIAADLRNHRPAGEIAAGFHVALARAVARVAADVRSRTGIDRVGLTGGVFQNGLLVRVARDELVRLGFRVLTHRTVPPNDGGLALGQVAIAGCPAGPAEAAGCPAGPAEAAGCPGGPAEAAGCPGAAEEEG
jgi:hydrogenase maturation protein HypF